MTFWMHDPPISVHDRVCLRRNHDLVGTVWDKRGTKCLVQWSGDFPCDARNPDHWYNVDDLERDFR